MRYLPLPRKSSPFRWDEERRLLLRAEFAAAFFHFYGLNRDDTAYIPDTFTRHARRPTYDV